MKCESLIPYVLHKKNPRPKDKFASRNRKCVSLGYSFGKKGGKCVIWRPTTFDKSRHAVEHTYLFVNEPKVTRLAMNNEILVGRH